MKKTYKLIVVLVILIFCNNKAYTQERIAFSKVKTQKYITNQFKVDETNYMEFWDIQTLDPVKVNLSEVSDIIFHSDSTCEIQVPRVNIIEVNCVVDSITKTHVYFRDNTTPEYEENIKRDNVFAILYSDSISKLKQYEQNYKQSKWQSISPKNKLLRENSQNKNLLKLHELNKGRLDLTFERKSDYKAIKTFVLCTAGDKIIVNSFIKSYVVSNKKSYILTSKDSWVPVKTVDKLNDDNIDLTIIKDYTPIEVRHDKSNMKALFFANYSKTKTSLTDNTENYKESKANEISNSVIVNFSYGYGYKLGKTATGLSEEQETLIKNLRSGRIVDASIALKFNKNSGIGFKFSEFASEYSKNSITSSFYGISYIADLLFANDKGHFYVDTSLGLGREETKPEGQKAFIGKSFAVHTNLRLNYMLTENIGIGGSVGLMMGSYDKIESKNGFEELKLSQAESLYRLETKLGISFYL